MVTVRRHQKSTLKQVAERANVSATTVSLFASGREDVCSYDTAERIRDAIKQLRYTPNSLSRSLRTRSTQTIGVAITRPRSPDGPQFSYADRLCRGIDEATDQAEYSQLFYPSSVRYGDSLSPFLDGRIDGLLANTGMNDKRAAEIAAEGMPLVIVGRGLEIPDGCGSVFADETDTVNVALSYLWSLGHRRIAHIAGPVLDKNVAIRNTGARSSVAIQRRDAFAAWMTEHGAYDEKLVAAAYDWIPGGDSMPEVMARWLHMPDRPTAIFAANDAHALWAIAQARTYGLDVPRDISIIGVDNQIDGMLGDIPVTTIMIPAEDIGSNAVKILLRMMNGAPIDECRLKLPVTDLIERQSTGPVRVSL